MIKAVKDTVSVSVLTLVSRILGVIRDMLIAVVFGVSIHTDAFFIAFRPFDLVRKLFSEGTLNYSFVPVFTRTLTNKGKSSAGALFFSFFLGLSLLSVLVMVLGLIFAPLLVKLIAPGFAASDYSSQLTVVLFKIMLPYFWLILLSAAGMGVLNSFSNFTVPALAPIVFNLVIIFCALVLSSLFNIPVTALALGVAVGGCMQVAVQMPAIIHCGILTKASLKRIHPEAVTIFKIMIPVMTGAATYQINIMTASFMASSLDTGAVSFLYYADRLVQFPLALFAVSSAMVLLPQFSRTAADHHANDMVPLFSNAVQLVFFVTIPAMAGLMALDEPIVSLLFGYGRFDIHAVHETACCLFWLSTGLIAFTGTRLFVTLYFSFSMITWPFISGVSAIVLNLILGKWLMGIMGLQGLVLAVSVSGMAGFMLLLVRLPGKVHINKKSILFCACRSFFVSAIMFALVRQAAALILIPGAGRVWYGAGVVSCVVLGVGFYFVINHLTSSPELALIKKGLCQKRTGINKD